MRRALFAGLLSICFFQGLVGHAEDSFRGFKKGDMVSLKAMQTPVATNMVISIESTKNDTNAPNRLPQNNWELYYGVVEDTGNQWMGINNFIRIKVYLKGLDLGHRDNFFFPVSDTKADSKKSLSVSFSEAQVLFIEGITPAQK